MAEDVDTFVLDVRTTQSLTALIQHVVGDDVTLVSSAEETAKDVRDVDRQRSSSTRGFASAGPRVPRNRDTSDFATPGRRFLGPEASSVSHAEGVDWQLSPLSGAQDRSPVRSRLPPATSRARWVIALLLDLGNGLIWAHR